MTRNTLLRLLVFFLGIPLLALSAVLFPEQQLPLFGALVVFASAVAAYEAAFFFPPHVRKYPARSVVIPAIGGGIPAIGYLSIHLLPSRVAPTMTAASLLLVTLTVLVSLTMAVQVLKRRETEIFQIINVVGAHVFLMIYPGLFAWHAVRIVSLPDPSILILVFVLSVFMNDSLAWVFGRLFGPFTKKKDAPPPVAVSPNKSVVGFVGGFLASIAVVLLAGAVFPTQFSGGVVRKIVFGTIVGVSAILGDLVESAFKRSATIKDSGQVIPGRGGLLDSIDSPLFAAPFYYYSYSLIFGF
mgnify:CR=1 FL=1